jgi:hypothetical protein
MKKWENMLSKEFQRLNKERGNSRVAVDLQLIQEIMDSGAEDDTEVVWSKVFVHSSFNAVITLLFCNWLMTVLCISGKRV